MHMFSTDSTKGQGCSGPAGGAINTTEIINDEKIFRLMPMPRFQISSILWESGMCIHYPHYQLTKVLNGE